jgi:hypothetical protein
MDAEMFPLTAAKKTPRSLNGGVHMVRGGVRCVAFATVTFVFAGCVEIDRRGGLIDQIEDSVLFKAETKSHRLLRSYALVGSLVTIARNSRLSEVDRTAMQGPLKAALEIVEDAYTCLYPSRSKTAATWIKYPWPGIEPERTKQSQWLSPAVANAYAQAPGAAKAYAQAAGVANVYAQATDTQSKPPGGKPPAATPQTPASASKPAPVPKFDHQPFDEYRNTVCIYFDERMARLDYAIYKIAASVLFDPDSRALLADVQDGLFGNIPVVGPAWKATVRATDAAAEAAKAVNQSATFGTALLTLSFNASNRWLYLLPIYRDTMEFGMRLVLQSLQYACQQEKSGMREDGFFRYVSRDFQACVAFNRGVDEFKNGNGSLNEWRRFLKSLNGNLLMVEAYPLHFALISRWIYRSCAQMFPAGSDKDGADTKKKILEKCGPLVEETEPTKRLTVQLEPGGPYIPMEARRRAPTVVPPAPESPAFAAPPSTPPGTTGSR